MTDYTREEVELMALAAGYELEWACAHWCRDGVSFEPWEKKAQCFDLAADAEIDVVLCTVDREKTIKGVVAMTKLNWLNCVHEKLDDHSARSYAYMHAICRAAIEKGRAMRGEG